MTGEGRTGRLTGMPTPDTPGGTPGTSASDDRRALAEEIERTRAELGAAVEALAAKADVKARAKEKAADVSGRVTGTASQVTAQLGAGTWLVCSDLAGKLSAAAQTVLSVRGPAAQQVAGRASRAGATVWHTAPEPARRAATRAVHSAQQRPMPLAVAASAAVLGWLIVAKRRR